MSSDFTPLTEGRFLEEASVRVLSRLHDDAAAAPEPIRDAFALIERKLFHRDLSRSAIEKSCPEAGRRFSELFRSVTAGSPVAYLRELRIETAKDLMRRTKLANRRISHLVGYRSYRGFAQAFKDLTEETPVEWRARLADTASARPASAPPRVERLDSWRRVFLGVADEALFHELLEKMLELYPEQKESCRDLYFEHKKDSELMANPRFQRAYEDFKVKRVAAVLERSDVRAGAKLRLVEDIPVSSFALCDLLLEKASELALKDPERSREWNRFAVSSLKPWRSDPREEVADRRLLALAQLARTSFAAGKEDEGDEALALAELKCRQPFEAIDPVARGALLEARAARQQLDVRATVEQAMEVYRDLGDEAGVERVSELGATVSSEPA